MASAVSPMADTTSRTLRALARLAVQGRNTEVNEAAKALKEITLHLLNSSSLANEAEAEPVRAALKDLIVALKNALAGGTSENQRELVKQAQTLKDKLMWIVNNFNEEVHQSVEEVERLSAESTRLFALTAAEKPAAGQTPSINEALQAADSAPAIVVARSTVPSSVPVHIRSPRDIMNHSLPADPWSTAPTVATAPPAATTAPTALTVPPVPPATAAPKSPATVVNEADELLQEFSLDKSISPRGSFLPSPPSNVTPPEYRRNTTIVSQADELLRDFADAKSPARDEWVETGEQQKKKSRDPEGYAAPLSPSLMYSPPMSPLSPSPSDPSSPQRSLSPDPASRLLGDARSSIEKNKLLEALIVGEEGRKFLSAFLASVPLEFQDELATAMLLVYMRNGKEIELIKWAIESEVARTTDEATLFRGSEIQARILSAYGRTLGTAYLFQVLDPTLDDICRGHVLELDETRLGEGEDLERNINRFLKVIDRVLDDVFSSTSNCPVQLRVMYALLQRAVVKKFPSMKHRCVGGQYFLRFLCPALTVPDSFSFRKKTTDEPSLGAAHEAKAIALSELPPKGTLTHDKARRSLVLLSKFLQNLANEVTNVKEVYMAPLVPAMDKHKARLQTFFDALVDVPESELSVQQPMHALLTDDVSLRAIRQIKKLMRTHLVALRKNPAYTPEMEPLYKETENLLISTSPEDLTSPRLLKTHESLINSQLYKSVFANAEDIEHKRQERSLLRQDSERLSADGKKKRSLRDQAKLAAKEEEKKKEEERKRKEKEDKEREKRLAKEEEERKKAQEDKEREERIKAIKAKHAVVHPSALEIGSAKGTKRETFAVADKKAPKKFVANLVVLHEKNIYIYEDGRSPAPRVVIPINKWTHCELAQTSVGGSFTVYNPSGQWWFSAPAGNVLTVWVAAIQAASSMP